MKTNDNVITNQNSNNVNHIQHQAKQITNPNNITTNNPYKHHKQTQH